MTQFIGNAGVRLSTPTSDNTSEKPIVSCLTQSPPHLPPPTSHPLYPPTIAQVVLKWPETKATVIETGEVLLIKVSSSFIWGRGCSHLRLPASEVVAAPKQNPHTETIKYLCGCWGLRLWLNSSIKFSGVTSWSQRDPEITRQRRGWGNSL